MIVDFQHHFIPRELAKEPAGTKTAVRFDKDGVPSMTPNSVLYDLDEHIRMMDAAGIDAAFLTSPPGMCVDTELSRLINDKTKAAEKDYPGRFRIVLVPGDFECPLNQREEDQAERLHRVRQLEQNCRGLAAAFDAYQLGALNYTP